MKYLLPLGAAVVVLAVALLGAKLLLMKESSEPPGTLTAQMESLAGVWESKKVAADNRVVNIVIGDAEADLDPMSLVAVPSAWERFKSRLSRAFSRQAPAAKAESKFCRAFADDSSSIRWTHEGFSVVSEEQMTREIVNAVVKAHDAGAEINIVTQGPAAAPALKAVASLEGAARGGAKVGVNKMVTVGVSREHLAKLDPLFFKNFKRPSNFREWSNVWSSAGFPRKMTPLDYSGPGQDGTMYELDEIAGKLLGQIAAGGLSVQDLVKLLRVLVGKVDEMGKQLAALSKDAQRDSAVEGKNVAAAAPTAAQDSLSMIKGGKDMADEIPEREKPCARCCASLGGTWRHKYPDSCCQKSDLPENFRTESCRANLGDDGNCDGLSDGHGASSNIEIGDMFLCR